VADADNGARRVLNQLCPVAALKICGRFYSRHDDAIDVSTFNEYLRKYCCPFPANPPSFTLDKFYMRQLQTSSKCWTSIGIPRATARPDNAHDLAHLCNLLPMLGPLHVSLNTQVMLVKQNRSVFKRLYESSTGNKLPKKPRSWRIIWIL